MATLKHFLFNGEHNFLLESGVTKLGTPAGVWASYRPPRKNKPGEVMMLYATNYECLVFRLMDLPMVFATMRVW